MQPNMPPTPAPVPQTPTHLPQRRISRRATWIGSVVALAVVAGIGWGAWQLTHKEPAAGGAMAQGGPGGGGPGSGGPGGPGGGGGGGGRRGPATTVGVAAAESAEIPVTLEALGTVVPQAVVRVRPQVSGVLQQIHFKEGQMVRRGELLATIDPRPFEMALQQAVGTRMQNEAQLEAARVTLQRYRTLLQQDSIARQEVDTQAATVRQLEAQTVGNKAAEGTARLNLGYSRIVAPITGRVGLRQVDVGNVISGSDANGVAVITQLAPIDVEFAVPQDHAAWLANNAKGYMEVKARDRTRTTLLDTGTFASLDNQIDTQTGTVRAKARFNNARQQLFPSQFVNVQLQLRVIRDAVVVPVAAVRQGGSGEYVFVLQPDRTVQLRPVVRGQVLGDRVQIASGLAIGERVVTEGADRLRDGSRVVLPGDAPGGGGRQGGRRRNAASAAAAGAEAPGAAASAGRPAAPGAAMPEATSPWAGASAAQAAPPAIQAPRSRPAAPDAPAAQASAPRARRDAAAAAMGAASR